MADNDWPGTFDSGAAKTGRRGARRRIRHRQAFAAARGVLGCGRDDQRSQHRKDHGQASQHGEDISDGTGMTLYRRIFVVSRTRCGIPMPVRVRDRAWREAPVGQSAPMPLFFRTSSLQENQ